MVFVKKDFSIPPTGGKADQPYGVIRTAERAVACHGWIGDRDNASLTDRYFNRDGGVAGACDDLGSARLGEAAAPGESDFTVGYRRARGAPGDQFLFLSPMQRRGVARQEHGHRVRLCIVLSGRFH